MTPDHDQDMIDEYRKPEYQPEYLTWDEAEERYEADEDDVVADALDALGEADVPEPVRSMLLNWYRGTPAYESAVQIVIDKAEER